MKRFVKFLNFLAGTIGVIAGLMGVSLLAVYVRGPFSSKYRFTRLLEETTIPAYPLENRTLGEVATFVESELKKSGVDCEVIVDARFSDRIIKNKNVLIQNNASDFCSELQKEVGFEGNMNLLRENGKQIIFCLPFTEGEDMPWQIRWFNFLNREDYK